MNNLFMELLKFLKDKGNITSVNWSNDSAYSLITFEHNGCKYTVSITKEAKKNED